MTNKSHAYSNREQGTKKKPFASREEAGRGLEPLSRVIGSHCSSDGSRPAQNEARRSFDCDLQQDPLAPNNSLWQRNGRY